MQPCKDKSWHDEKGFMGGLRLMTVQFANFEVLRGGAACNCGDQCNRVPLKLGTHLPYPCSDDP